MNAMSFQNKFERFNIKNVQNVFTFKMYFGILKHRLHSPTKFGIITIKNKGKKTSQCLM